MKSEGISPATYAKYDQAVVELRQGLKPIRDSYKELRQRYPEPVAAMILMVALTTMDYTVNQLAALLTYMIIHEGEAIPDEFE